MKVEVVTPEDYTGSVIGDLNSRRGQIQGQDMRGNANVITAMVPLANMFGYVNNLRSMSQGRATFTMQFDHYDQVPASDRRGSSGEIRLSQSIHTELDARAGTESPMAKAKFEPQQAALQYRHDRSRRSRQDVVDGGDHQGTGGNRPGATYTAYDQIDKAPEEKARGITIATAHVEYETDEAPLRACRLPRPRRLCEEHDHRRRADGRRDPGGERGRRPDAADPRAHPAGPPGRRAGAGRLPQQGRHGRRSGAARAGRARSPRAAVEVQFPRRQDPGDQGLGADARSRTRIRSSARTRSWS